MRAEIKIAPDASALGRMAADVFQCAAESAISSRNRFAVALSGGNTPRGVYSLLAEQYKHLPWKKIHIFFGDERCVPPDHPDSNFRMANEALLSRVPVPAENVHRIRTELPPGAAAEQYDNLLRNFFHLAAGGLPRFDLILLGLGDDGHTASLFPGTEALNESSRLAMANWVEKLKTFRITLTFPVLNHAAEVLFLAAGPGKAEILSKVLSNSPSAIFPAQRVQPQDGRLLWLVDHEAAKLLPQQKSL